MKIGDLAVLRVVGEYCWSHGEILIDVADIPHRQIAREISYSFLQLFDFMNILVLLLSEDFHVDVFQFDFLIVDFNTSSALIHRHILLSVMHVLH